MSAGCVIVDANIAFKTLAGGRGDLRGPVSPSVPLRFFAPRFLFVELFKHKTEDAALKAGLRARGFQMFFEV